MDSVHKGHRERLREKCIKNGLESFAPHEVLELLLFNTIARKDTNPLAHELLNKYHGNIAKVFRADIEELKTVPGIGDNSAFLIHLIPQIVRYYTLAESEHDVFLGTTEKLGEFAVALCMGKKEEDLFVICLDSNKNLKDYTLIEKGSVNQVNINIRKIAEYAMRESAVNLVLVHNHPNGSRFPSKNDKVHTFEIIKALSKLSINILDHIVVAGDMYYSMNEMDALVEPHSF